MKLACIQPWLQKDASEENVEKACSQAHRVIDAYNPDLVMFPEAFPSYLSEECKAKSETLGGATTKHMQQLAADGNCLVLFGMLREEPDGLHNSAVLIDEFKVLGVYDKTHLYYSPTSNPTFNEQNIFVRGEKLGLFDTNIGRIGVMICHDGTYPELPRALVLEGADLICWLMNDGNCISWARHYARWCTVPIAIANKANAGGSAIVDGDGRSIVEAPAARAIELMAELDVAKWRKLRAEGEGPQAVYRVRRPDLYSALTLPYREAREMTGSQKT